MPLASTRSSPSVEGQAPGADETTEPNGGAHETTESNAGGGRDHRAQNDSRCRGTLVARMKPTIKDVAVLAGVSTATVSSVVTGRRGVSPELRERVMAAVEATGYRPNLVAQSLRDRRTLTIGVSVPDITNPFFNAVVRAIDGGAFAAGFHVLLVSSDERSAVERTRIENLVARQVDGLIIIPTDDEVAYADDLVRQRVPAVFVDRGSPRLPFDLIQVDNYRAAYEGARYLGSLGHRRIAAVGTSTDLHNIRQRFAGFHAALDDIGIPGADRVAVAAGLDDADGSQTVGKVLGSENPPTALFCLTNRMALHAMRAVNDLALRVPADLSILGFDDVDWVTAVHPAVSTVAQPLHALGQRAWDTLRARIADAARPLERVALSCQLVIRGSTAPAPTPGPADAPTKGS